MHLFRCVVLLGLVFAGACGDDDNQTITAVSPRPAANRAAESLPQFPEFVAWLPPARIADGSQPLPALPSDEELAQLVSLASGHVMIGLKSAGALRSRETGVVPGINRRSALGARAAVEAMGAQIVRTYRHMAFVEARVTPDLAVALRRHPMVNYVEAVFPFVPQQAPAQDTSWGVRLIGAPLVWTGTYGVSASGTGVQVVVIDNGFDYEHRWSSLGDGPSNMGLDCSFASGSGATDCYHSTRPHGAHVAGII